MTQMIRKQIYIQPAQDATLKQRAMMLGVTEAELIRRAIDRHMAVLAPVSGTCLPGIAKRPL
ncbi:MAG: CopG family transcriptional regulator [Pseudomonadota bacterium]